MELLENLVAERVNFVIRLEVGPNFCDGKGKPVVLSIHKGETRILPKVFYRGKVFVNVIGVWREGFSEPIWVTPALAAGASVTKLDAKVGLAIYDERMKIEEAFRDLKTLLNFHKLMNKRRILMEKMVALILIAYAIVLILGEILRSQLFQEGCRKDKLFPGPFTVLKLKPFFSPPLLVHAQAAFHQLILPVRNNVQRSGGLGA